MADQKLTQLTETTDAPTDSMLYVVKDPSTVPLSRKISFSNLSLSLGMTPDDGWVPLTPTSDSRTYASASTVTVPAGAEAVYNKGDKVRLKQGGGYKYFYIYDTTDTVLSLTGGSDFALTTDAITDVYYSKIENPLNFPDWFNWTVTHTGFSSPPSYLARFKISGKACTIIYCCYGVGTSNATDYSVSLPVVAAAISNFDWQFVLGLTYDNTGYIQTPGTGRISTSGTIANLFKGADGGSSAWTASNSKMAKFQVIYEI